MTTRRDLSPLIPNSRASVTIISDHNEDDESFDISFNISSADDMKAKRSLELPLEKDSSEEQHSKKIQSKQTIAEAASPSPSSSPQPSTSTLLLRHGSNRSNSSPSSSTPNRRRSSNHNGQQKSPIKPTLPSSTINMFSKLLPNQQMSKQHMQQLNHPIALPASLPISTLSPATQQLATFLIDHLQAQQGHLASLQSDVYKMRDVVWAGGLVLQKHQKNLAVLEDSVTEHQQHLTVLEGNVSDLRNELLQQEARLRSEIIYQRQRQVLERMRFASEQRQSRIDNIFDSAILLLSLLLTSLSPVSAVNSTLASLFVSTMHLMIKNVGDRNPYTWERLSQPQDLTKPQSRSQTQAQMTKSNKNSKFQPNAHLSPQDLSRSVPQPPLSHLASSQTQSPISQLTHMGSAGQIVGGNVQNGHNFVQNGQNSSNFAANLTQNPSNLPLWSSAPSPQLYVVSTPHETIVLNESQRLRRRHFRTAMVRGGLRIAQILYLFLFFRKFLVNFGLIQSPLSAYSKAVLPPTLYQALSSISIEKIKRKVVVPFDWVMSIGEKTPYKTFPDELPEDSVDEFVMKEPMSKEAIYERVLGNLKMNPALAHEVLKHGDVSPQDLNPQAQESTAGMKAVSDVEMGLQGGGGGEEEGEGDVEKEHLRKMRKMTSTVQQTVQQSFTSTALKAILPTWASDYLSPFADKFVSALNPLAPPSYESVVDPLHSHWSQNDPNSSQFQKLPTSNPNNYSHLSPYNPYGHDYTTQQLLRTPFEVELEGKGEGEGGGEGGGGLGDIDCQHWGNHPIQSQDGKGGQNDSRNDKKGAKNNKNTQRTNHNSPLGSSMSVSSQTSYVTTVSRDGGGGPAMTITSSLGSGEDFVENERNQRNGQSEQNEQNGHNSEKQKDQNQKKGDEADSTQDPVEDSNGFLGVFNSTMRMIDDLFFD